MVILDNAELHRVEELRLRSPLTLLEADEALIAQHRDWLEPHFMGADDCCDFVFQSWILQLDGRIVLIDPCTGNGRPNVMPPFDRLDVPFIERFEATGVRPDQVDYVFCTHFHHDHCGWNTQLRDGRYVPTFPNARYVFVQREYERWDPRRPGFREVDYNIGVFERSILPVMEAGLAELVGDHHHILPGLQVHPAHGHTAGHSILQLTPPGGQAWFTGDLFHHPLQMIDPALHMPGCDDLAQAIRSRRWLVTRALESHALLIPAHFPEPFIGRLRQTDGITRFEPGLG